MSYETMDHAAWVEQNAEAAKSMKSRTGRKRRKDNQHGWDAAPEKLSPFQAQVFDILGIAGGGIYNAPIAWDAINWRWGSGIAVPWAQTNSLSTFDFSPLTMLVFLCHEARIRFEICAHGPSYLLFVFHPREATGPMAARHPSLDEAITELRRRMPVDHRIFQPRPRRLDEEGKLLPEIAA